jgi:epoxyqueuosine reductase
MEMSRELRGWVEARARELGFALCGVAAVPAEGSVEERRETERFADWVKAGRAGDMEYLEQRDAEGRLVRGSLRLEMPWAESVIVCAADYSGDGVRSDDAASAGTGWIARYAAGGRDYHDVLEPRLKALERELQERVPGVKTRSYVDTGPIVERNFARDAGLGWVGKNTCLLNEERGSWLLLGVVVTSLRLPVELIPEAAVDRCGSCTRCIDACPTEALIAPRQMDATRCISYLTIEKKDAIEPELMEGMGRNIFGCDICQEVCPWNERAGERGAAGMPELQPVAERVNVDLENLAEIAAGGFLRLYRDTPVERTGLRRLRRNVAIAMGNSGERRFLPKLRAWSDAVDEAQREAARWAIRKIEGD